MMGAAMKTLSGDDCEKWLSNDADAPGKFDEEGYLCDPQTWSESMARCIASRDGFGELTQAHWAIIRALRDGYFKYGGPMAPRYFCHVSQMEKNCLNTLFANNTNEAWRIAGLPNPGEEAKAYW